MQNGWCLVISHCEDIFNRIKTLRYYVFHPMIIRSDDQGNHVNGNEEKADILNIGAGYRVMSTKRVTWYLFTQRVSFERK